MLFTSAEKSISTEEFSGETTIKEGRKRLCFLSLNDKLYKLGKTLISILQNSPVGSDNINFRFLLKSVCLSLKPVYLDFVCNCTVMLLCTQTRCRF